MLPSAVDDDYIDGEAILHNHDHYFYRTAMKERDITFVNNTVEKEHEVTTIVDLTPELIQMRQNLGKDTYETLKKLKVIAERTQRKVEKEQKREQMQEDSFDESDGCYWEESNMEKD